MIPLGVLASQVAAGGAPVPVPILFRAATADTAFIDTSAPWLDMTWTLPTGHTADDLLVLFAGGKPYDTGVPGVPSGYTDLGSGANGTTAVGAAGTGSVFSCARCKVHSGTEYTPSATMSGATNPVLRFAIALYCDDPATWDVDSCHGSDATETGTAYSATGDATLDFQTGDWVVASFYSNDDQGGASGLTVTIPGCTLGTVSTLTSNATSSGQDGRGYIIAAEITAGTASGAPVVSCTTSTGESGGQSTILRVRATA